MRRSESTEMSNDNSMRVSEQKKNRAQHAETPAQSPAHPRKRPHGTPKHCLHTDLWDGQ